MKNDWNQYIAKIPRFAFFRYSLFISWEIDTNINTFFKGIHNGKWDIFSPFVSHLEYLTWFSSLSSGYFYVISWFAMQNPYRLFIFGCLLKPEALEGCFKTEKLDFFHSYWMNVIWAQRYMYWSEYNYRNTEQKMVEAETWDRV